MSPRWEGCLKRIDDYRWEIPQAYRPGMSVPGLVYTDQRMLDVIRGEESLEQVANVAFLPGIVGRSLAMPDIHWGYGFPIGGVAATRVDDGVISPGGVGFDINCGVRLLRTNLTVDEIKPHIESLVNALFTSIPSGVGSRGKLKVDDKELAKVMTRGAAWAVERGYGDRRDLEMCEESGAMRGANPDKVGPRARERGVPQLGTLGSGNHFLEIQAVDRVFDAGIARVFGIEGEGQILILIHTGSRGFGHQVCEDYLKVMDRAVARYGIRLPDRQLVCAPVVSSEGQDYFAAMACAANYAWANRQCITHWVRECFARILGKRRPELGLEVIYDVAHNIAKVEEHTVGKEKRRLCVHRKGATRSFPAGHPDIPPAYRQVGQPVLIPGDMGRYSFVAVGSNGAMEETFGSTCHGAGRLQSRGEAKRSQRHADIAQAMAEQGILVRAASRAGLAEESSQAYKDVEKVVEIAHQAGISYKVARARPLGVIKG